MDPLSVILIYCSVRQMLKRPPSLGSFSRVSCQHRLVERERLQGWLQPLHVTQHYLLASVVARISSKGISHNDLLPHAPHVVSSQATADLSLGLLSSLYAPAPAAMCSRALASLSRVCKAVARIVCVFLISFRLS